MKDQSFVRKKVSSLTLGEKIRQLREDRRMRIHDLSRRINVKEQYLEALEKGQYNMLPTKVYVKGFVRSQARFFGVPEKVLLNLFEREYSVYHNINNTDEEETVNKLPQVPRFVFTPRVIMIGFGLMILSAVGLYLYFSVDNFISSPWLVVDEPARDSVIMSDVVRVQGRTRNNSRVFINGQQVFVDMDGSFADEVGLAQGINTVQVKSVNKFDKETIENLVVDAQYVITQKPEQKQETIRLFIKADQEPIWISITADDVDIFNDTIRVDDVKEFSAVGKFKVTSSSGRETLVSFDGEKFEQMSIKDEIVKDWVYPQEKDDSDTDVSVDATDAS